MVSAKPCALALALALCGCAASAPQAPIVATVPIPLECPAPPRLALPQLPVAALRPDSPPADVGRAYAATVQILKDAVKQRELLLDGYRDDASKTSVYETPGSDDESSSRAGCEPR